MEENLDTSQLNQSALQDLIGGGGSAPSLIPETLITTLTVGFIVLNVLGILFFIFYVISMVRKWKVESATLKMQKDISEIKTILAKQSTTAPITNIRVDPVRPAQSSAIIARPDEPTNSTTLS